MGEYLVSTMEPMDTPHVSISFLCPFWVQLAFPSDGHPSHGTAPHPLPKVRDPSSSAGGDQDAQGSWLHPQSDTQPGPEAAGLKADEAEGSLEKAFGETRGTFS